MKPGPVRLGLVAAGAALYGALALAALRALGPGAASLVMIPVCVAALLWGTRGAIPAVAAGAALELGLSRLAGVDLPTVAVLPQVLAFGVLAVAAGRLADVDFDRRQRWRAERSREQRVRALAERLPVLLWSTDPGLRIDFCSGAQLKPGDMAPGLEAHRRALSGDATAFDMRLGDRVYEARVEPLKEGAEEAAGTIGTALDVTEKRQGELRDVAARERYITHLEEMEEALRASESRYRALVEASPDAVLVTDADGRAVLWNRQLLVLLGASEQEELSGRPAWDFAAPEERAAVSSWIRRAGSTGPRSGLEFTLTGLDGQRRPAELSVAAVRDAGGSSMAAIGLIRDISERRRTEAALRESEAKTRFLATMSHELRTPLNSVLGFAQLLASSEFGSLTPRQERYVENIRASGRHLLDLVNDVLSVAEVEAGHVVPRLEPVELRSVLTGALSRARGAAEAKEMRLELERGRPLWARADRDRLGQVVDNLLANAIKFTPAGGRVWIAVDQVDAQVEITVRDTGVGIPEDEQSRIFDQFVQVDSGRTREQQGTGLGLAITRELVQLMGGTIRVTSSPGEGSAFTVSLPPAAYDPRSANGAEIRGAGAATSLTNPS